MNFNEYSWFFHLVHDNDSGRNRCWHCAECRQHRVNVKEYIWDFFCNDFENLIGEIRNKIYSKQYEKLEVINEYKDKYSRDNIGKWLADIINIKGIASNICGVILDFVSHEYPMVDNTETINKGKCKHYLLSILGGLTSLNMDEFTERLMVKWLHDTDDEYVSAEDTKNDIDYPDLWNEVSSCIYSKSCVLKKEHRTLSIVGEFAYGKDVRFIKHVYFWYKRDGDDDHKMIFTTRWLSLWNRIDNMSMKIDCYSFLFDKDIDEQYGDGEEIKETKNKRKKRLSGWIGSVSPSLIYYYDDRYYSK